VWFEIREICVPPRCEHAYVEAEWRDALVIVERGAIEVEFTGGGGCCRFVRGDILFLTGLHIRTLRNPGNEPAVLLAISRGGGVGQQDLGRLVPAG
jgi:hypothetical protein